MPYIDMQIAYLQWWNAHPVFWWVTVAVLVTVYVVLKYLQRRG